MGIEPTAQAWEAWVLPLYDARLSSILVGLQGAGKWMQIPTPHRGHCSSLRLVHPLAAEHRSLDLDIEPQANWKGERILPEHDEVGQLAGLDRSFLVFLERRIGAFALQLLVHAKNTIDLAFATGVRCELKAGRPGLANCPTRTLLAWNDKIESVRLKSRRKAAGNSS